MGAADRPGSRALHEPQDHPDGGGGGGGRRPRRRSLVGGGVQGVGREEAELSWPRRRGFVFYHSFYFPSGCTDVQRPPVGKAAREPRWRPTLEAAAVIWCIYCT